MDSQRRDFRRLGVLGDGDHPYLTLDPHFEAEQIRGFARIIENGAPPPGLQARALVPRLPFRTRGGGSGIPGQDLHRPRRPYRRSSTGRLYQRLDLRAGGPVSIPIWTTTPWTLPANQAVALGADLPYVLVEAQLDSDVAVLVLAEGSPRGR